MHRDVYHNLYHIINSFLSYPPWYLPNALYNCLLRVPWAFWPGCLRCPRSPSPGHWAPSPGQAGGPSAYPVPAPHTPGPRRARPCKKEDGTLMILIQFIVRSQTNIHLIWSIDFYPILETELTSHQSGSSLSSAHVTWFCTTVPAALLKYYYLVLSCCKYLMKQNDV